jgi:hypothetical protein
MRAFCGDLRIQIGDIGLRLIDLCVALVGLHLEVAGVEPHQHGAGLDELIVRHRHVDDLGIELRADGDGAGVDEGVVGRYIFAGVDPPHGHADDDGDADRRDRQHQRPMRAHAVKPGRFLQSLGDTRPRRAARHGLLAAFVIDALVHAFDRTFGARVRFPSRTGRRPAQQSFSRRGVAINVAGG